MIDNNKQLKDEIFDLFQENLVDVLQFDDQDLLYDLNDDIIDIIVYDNIFKKLLQLYRNLKFFPDSMKDIPVDDWEIVPIDKFVVKKHSELSGPPKTKGEKEIEKLRQEEGDYAENSLERKMLEEEVEKKEQIENLQSEANKYPQGSLEKKALESEIKKLLK